MLNRIIQRISWYCISPYSVRLVEEIRLASKQLLPRKVHRFLKWTPRLNLQQPHLCLLHLQAKEIPTRLNLLPLPRSAMPINGQ